MKSILPFYTIGHFINQPDNPTEFEILRFNKMQEPEVDEFHLHNFYEIIWTEKGASRQRIEDSEYEVAANTFFIISPNQVHYFEEWRPLTGGSILFTEDFYLLNRVNKDTLFEFRCLDNYYSNPRIRFTEEEFGELLLTIRLMEREHARADRNASIIQSFLHILLSQVQRYNDNKLATPISRKFMNQFKQFKRSLESHFGENKSAGFYANELSITQHHLNLVCREVANCTTTDIIKGRSVLEAKRLLSFTDKTIAEISDHLNYTDSSHFNRTFRAFTGQSPQQFKSKMSERYLIK